MPYSEAIASPGTCKATKGPKALKKVPAKKVDSATVSPVRSSDFCKTMAQRAGRTVDCPNEEVPVDAFDNTAPAATVQ